MKCLIIGATGVIGSAIARLLYKEGHSIHLVDASDEDRLVKIARELKSTFSICNLTEIHEINNLFDEQTMPDTLINAVGRSYWGNFESIPQDYFEKSFDVNFFSPLFIALAAVKRWLANRRDGKILTISSISAHKVCGANTIAYATARHALDLGMRILAHEVNKYGIRVGTICPAKIDTQFWDNRDTIDRDLINDQDDILNVDDVAGYTYRWLTSSNPPYEVFIPDTMKDTKTTYGMETRQIIDLRLQQLALAGHRFPPESGVAVVTGASGGLGKEITKRLSIKGWKVIGVARNVDRLNALKKDLANYQIEVMAGDVSNKNLISGVLNDVILKFGKIDLIVNNAGSSLMGPCLDMAPGDIRRVFNINFYGYYNLTKESLNYLKKSKGTILNVVSVAAFKIFPALPYSCAKIAQAVLSETLKDEFLQYGIRVLDIFPGNIATQFFKNAETTDGQPFQVPVEAMTVESAGVAFMRLLYGRRFTLTVPKYHLKVYSRWNSTEALKAFCPEFIKRIVKRIRNKIVSYRLYYQQF